MDRARLRMLPRGGVVAWFVRLPALPALGSSVRAHQWQSRAAGVVKDRSQLEKQTAQERAPLLSPGKTFASQMVSVATEAREEAVLLLKGVYVQDAGVATESGGSERGASVDTKEKAAKEGLTSSSDPLPTPQASDSVSGGK
ncbi:hypothetical protein NDU88_004118 [Pleurodeles waltl]|uniref:Uncharacterized protein n=1 Tax=Pleurodeles waltl TaxID=8319 RepID=A0AAV7NIG0_PLEWA|nr:hypothetical protein NDU88_004118 [Pleurodeles waltl]